MTTGTATCWWHWWQSMLISAGRGCMSGMVGLILENTDGLYPVPLVRHRHCYVQILHVSWRVGGCRGISQDTLRKSASICISVRVEMTNMAVIMKQSRRLCRFQTNRPIGPRPQHAMKRAEAVEQRGPGRLHGDVKAPYPTEAVVALDAAEHDDIEVVQPPPCTSTSSATTSG